MRCSKCFSAMEQKGLTYVCTGCGAVLDATEVTEEAMAPVQIGSADSPAIGYVPSRVSEPRSWRTIFIFVLGLAGVAACIAVGIVFAPFLPSVVDVLRGEVTASHAAPEPTREAELADLSAYEVMDGVYQIDWPHAAAPIKVLARPGARETRLFALSGSDDLATQYAWSKETLSFRKIGETQLAREGVAALAVQGDGGLSVARETGGKLQVNRLDQSGQTLWSHRFEGLSGGASGISLLPFGRAVRFIGPTDRAGSVQIVSYGADGFPDWRRFIPTASGGRSVVSQSPGGELAVLVPESETVWRLYTFDREGAPLLEIALTGLAELVDVDLVISDGGGVNVAFVSERLKYWAVRPDGSIAHRGERAVQTEEGGAGDCALFVGSIATADLACSSARGLKVFDVGAITQTAGDGVLADGLIDARTHVLEASADGWLVYSELTSRLTFIDRRRVAEMSSIGELRTVTAEALNPDSGTGAPETDLSVAQGRTEPATADVKTSQEQVSPPICTVQCSHPTVEAASFYVEIPIDQLNESEETPLTTAQSLDLAAVCQENGGVSVSGTSLNCG